MAFAILLVVVGLGLTAPWLGYEPALDVDPSRAGIEPGFAHWLGTDHLGRDVFWRLLYACQSFAGPGLMAAAVVIATAVPAGAAAGYHGGWVETPLRFLFTVVASVPRFVFILLAASAYGADTWVLAIATGVTYAPTLGEAVFSRIESLRSAEYIVANRAHGVPGWRILWLHLVWAACRRLILRHAVTVFAYFLVLETTLSYIGSYGVQEPTPSWGNMLVFEWGRDANIAGVVAPVLAIWAVVGACTVLADALVEPAHER